jgi:hypothetical protein
VQLSDPGCRTPFSAAFCNYQFPIALSAKMCIFTADKSLARPTSPCILSDGENYSLDASLVYINSTNIPPIMIIDRVYENQNLLSL